MDFHRRQLQKIRNAFKFLYKKGLNFSQAVTELKRNKDCNEINELIEFFNNSNRGITGGEK